MAEIIWKNKSSKEIEGKLDNTSTIRGSQSKENVEKKLTKNGYIK